MQPAQRGDAGCCILFVLLIKHLKVYFPILIICHYLGNEISEKSPQTFAYKNLHISVV
jgi:hypothetical protein